MAPLYGRVMDIGDTYEVQAIPVDSQNNPTNDTGIIFSSCSTTNLEALGCITGLSHYYQVRVRTRDSNNISDWATLPSGVYDPDGPTISGQALVNYSYPFYAELPLLPDDGTLDVVSDPFGFHVDIGGWGYGSEDSDLQADEFELGWTLSSEVDFEQKGQIVGNQTQFMTTVNRSFSVNVSQQATYTVAVRPIQNGQVVGHKKQQTVTAGGGGAPADYVGYFMGEINVHSHAGTIADASNATIGGLDNGFVTFPACSFTRSPFSATASGISLSQNQIAAVGGGKGSNLEITSGDGSISYGIGAITAHDSYNDTGSGDTLDITALEKFSTGYNQSGNKFSIATSKNARKIGEFTVTNDITIKVAVVDIQ